MNIPSNSVLSEALSLNSLEQRSTTNRGKGCPTFAKLKWDIRAKREPAFGGAGLRPCRLTPRSKTALAAEGILLATLALTGCKTTPPPKPLEQLTAQERAGRNVFLQQCSLCHDDRTGTAMKGPSLLGIYKKQYLPSGAPANDDRITNVVLHGRGMMPAIGGQLNSDDVADLLAYLKTL